jgi:hypothetical protein
MNGPTFTSPRSKTKKTNTPVVDADIDQAKETAQTTHLVVHHARGAAARGKAARAEFPARVTPAGTPFCRPIPWTLDRRRAACRTSFPSATAGCSLLRSRSTVARPT